MYHDLQQRKKLPTIILLNVTACIPKDLSSQLTKKKRDTALKTTNALVFHVIPCQTQSLQYSCNWISFENPYKSSLFVQEL